MLLKKSNLLFPCSSFVIYRCEKNYMRRRFQDTFHVGGHGGGGGAGGQHALPSISVSVQTEPAAAAALNGHLANGHADGIAAETTILPAAPTGSNGGSGGAASGNGAASGGGGTRSIFSAHLHHTLPHGSSAAHHHRQLMSSSNYGILHAANGGANGELGKLSLVVSWFDQNTTSEVELSFCHAMHYVIQ